MCPFEKKKKKKKSFLRLPTFFSGTKKIVKGTIFVQSFMYCKAKKKKKKSSEQSKKFFF